MYLLSEFSTSDRKRRRGTVESTRRLSGLFMKGKKAVTGHLTKENCIAAYLLIYSIRQLGRKGGWLHASLYLKTASSCLMAYYGGHRRFVLAPRPISVSLTRCGLPSHPTEFRKMRIRDENADRLVRLYLSWFSLSKLRLLVKRGKKSRSL